jgi:hypothetical protein
MAASYEEQKIGKILTSKRKLTPRDTWLRFALNAVTNTTNIPYTFPMEIPDFIEFVRNQTERNYGRDVPTHMLQIDGTENDYCVLTEGKNDRPVFFPLNDGAFFVFSFCLTTSQLMNELIDMLGHSNFLLTEIKGIPPVKKQNQ